MHEFSGCGTHAHNEHSEARGAPKPALLSVEPWRLRLVLRLCHISSVMYDTQIRGWSGPMSVRLDYAAWRRPFQLTAYCFSGTVNSYSFSFPLLAQAMENNKGPIELVFYRGHFCCVDSVSCRSESLQVFLWNLYISRFRCLRRSSFSDNEPHVRSIRVSSMRIPNFR